MPSTRGERGFMMWLLALGLGRVGASAVAATPETGKVQVTTDPPGVAIYTVLPTGEDDFLCQSPCEATFARGAVTLKARHPGLVEVSKSVRVTARPTKVTMKLALVDKHTMVDVTVGPEVDEVEVDGMILYTSGWVVLPYGEHWAIGKHEGRIVWEATFTTMTPRHALVVTRERPVN